MLFYYHLLVISKNWHTHTHRCGHAIGSDEEYIQAAIKAGIKVLGFSDHAPYKTPRKHERMDYEQLDEYIQSLHDLKIKYQDQIDIYIGLEVECYTSQWEDLIEYRKRMDYLILGQHHIDFDSEGGYSSYYINDKSHLEQYVDRIELALKHHLVDYIAHPDVCLFSYENINDEAVLIAANRLADLSNYYQIPLEINCGTGIKLGPKKYQSGWRYAYPTRAFFEVFATKKCPLIIGMDTHNPVHFLTDDHLNQALEILEGLDLNIVNDTFNPKEHADKDKLLITPLAF